MRFWTLSGPGAIVKVLSLADATGPRPPAAASGYLTQAKFLKGLNSSQIERDLGLQPQSLKQGGFVCYLARLPTYDEVEYRFSAALPDGQFWTSQMHEEFDRARSRYTGMRGEVIEGYPPGSERALQWRLKPGVAVPFSGSRVFISPVISFSV